MCGESKNNHRAVSKVKSNERPCRIELYIRDIEIETSLSTSYRPVLPFGMPKQRASRD